MFDFDPAAPNVTPSRYRQVALATVESLAPAALHRHFVGREAYLRTRFIVARCNDETTLIEIDRPESDKLFSVIRDIRVLADAGACVYIDSPSTDVGVPSQLAAVAETYASPLGGYAGDSGRSLRCVVVEGRYCHVSFLLNPSPLRIRVLDIVPPAPSKLADQAQRVLDIGEDLPPIVLITEAIDSRDLLALDAPESATAEANGPINRVLLPCRVSGSDLDPGVVRFLDQRPAHEEWTLLGCQRSQQIHSWFYGENAPMVDTCPRRFLSGAGEVDALTLTRCCLLQEGMERRGRTALVPWGSSLDEVRAAMVNLAESEGFSWTPT
jgi:hypothetical protein